MSFKFYIFNLFSTVLYYNITSDDIYCSMTLTCNMTLSCIRMQSTVNTISIYPTWYLYLQLFSSFFEQALHCIICYIWSWRKPPRMVGNFDCRVLFILTPQAPLSNVFTTWHILKKFYWILIPAKSSPSYEQPTSYERPFDNSPKWHFLQMNLLWAATFLESPLFLCLKGDCS